MNLGLDTLAAIAEVLGTLMQAFFSESSTVQTTPENIRHETIDIIYKINNFETLT